MKQAKIRISGKQVFENDDELEEGYVEIELEIKDLLDEIDNEDIEDYARFNLDLKHEDEFESDLGDFSEDDLVRQLEYNGYNFAQKVSEEDCIEVLEIGGYVITDKNDEENRLDYVDATMLEEIKNLFLTSSCAERKKIYDKIKNGL